MSNDMGRLFNIADKLAQKRKDQFISSELMLLAALEDRGHWGEGASRVSTRLLWKRLLTKLAAAKR